MAKLIATRSILYQNYIYEGGDTLPYYDEATVNAWVDAGSAKWVDDEPVTAKAEAEDILPPPVIAEDTEPKSTEEIAPKGKRTRTRKS